MKSLAIVVLLTGIAAAEPTVTVTPTSVAPGDPVLVTVSGADAAPRGKAGGQPLGFFADKVGYRAVFAVPLTVNEDHILIEVVGQKPVSVPIAAKTFPDSKVVVEEEMANPTPEDGKLIDADNAAMAATYAKAEGKALFTGAFLRPVGSVTSTFGEWRTFNDGHRSQHLGSDFGEAEGTRVHAVNAGTVVLVRETFLAGNVVVVAHGGGISSLYFHLARATVREGDRVDRGGVIGAAGHTGRTTGPHLHLSIHVQGGMVDPAAFLKLPLAK
jgi:murein DD-endopeptidase MepM/ murein hydrolase activator NlpD